MNFSTDMSAAPRGKTVPTPVKTKDGVKLVDQFRRERILAVHPDSDVQPSYWIPPRYTTEGTLLEGGRWSGFNRGADPIAWAPWPTYEPSAQQKTQLTGLMALGAAETVHIEDCGSGA